MKKYLTRSEYCLGIRCPGLLWSHRNHPDSLSAFSEHTLAWTHNKKARELYTADIKDCIFISDDDIDKAALETEKAINDGKLSISNAAFVSGSLSCRCDLLKRRSDGTYALYVIKAAAHVRQSICHDASYQVFVLATCKIRVSRVFFVKLNTCFEKGKSNEKERFILENISSRVASLVSGVEGRARSMLKAASGEAMPKSPIHNGCFNPSDCENKHICFASLPEDNVFTMSGVSHETKFKLYRKGKYSFEDMLKEGALEPLRKKQVEMYLNDSPPETDKASLKKFLSELWYPMCFLDFETMQLPFPPYDGLHPFEPCAFQFSLHTQKKEGGKVSHYSCIAKPGEDPRRTVAKALIKHIPDNACIIAYNMQLEKMMLLSLADTFPDLADRLRDMASRLYDMMRPFEKRWYYDGKMKGSCSLKSVLHALYPDDESLDYHSLSRVHNGQEATTVYAFLTESPESYPEKDTILRALEDYCALDTYAMIKLLQKLREAID
ncbi:MAG: DUF2779 domain-containing protein [Clostridia bacterium]|nr:DUF2779 domain-containing protein [Clostridia bacterium]